MNRWKLWSLAAGLGMLGVVAVYAGSEPSDNAQAAANPERLPHPVVDTHDLMELFNQPLYRYLKQEMQQQPTDDKGWETLHERGLQAAEIVNLVAIREMKAEHRTAWDKHNRTARQAALEFAKAAETKDWQATTKAYRSLIQNCNDCHQDIAPDHAPTLKP